MATTVALGAAGIVGIAFETLAAPGTYVAPTKFIPIENESLTFDQDIRVRRPIQGVVDPVGARLGNGSVSGDLVMAAYHDVVPYFLYASRATVIKAGAGPYTYTAEGSHQAEPAYTLSITIVRNGEVFGYTGCAVSSQSWSIDDGIEMVTWSIVGRDEAEEASPTPSFTSVGKEFGAGSYTIEYADTATSSVDDITFSVDDSGEALFRVSGTTGADLIVFGERETTVSLSRDFLTRDEYDSYFRTTAGQKWEWLTSNGTESINIHVPVAIITSHDVPLSAQGDIVRATIEYDGNYNATLGSAYEIVVSTTENITVPVA